MEHSLRKRPQNVKIRDLIQDVKIHDLVQDIIVSALSQGPDKEAKYVILGEKAKVQLIRGSKKDIDLCITELQKNPLNYTQIVERESEAGGKLGELDAYGIEGGESKSEILQNLSEFQFSCISNHPELIKLNPKDETDKQKKDAEFSAAVLSSDIDVVGGNTQTESFMGLNDVRHCGKMGALEKFMLSWVS